MLTEPSTPPTVVDEWNVASDLAKIAQQWGPLREILERPESFQELSPEVSQWSSGLHAGHLALGSFFMAEMIEQCLADPSPNQDPIWAGYTEPIFRKGGFRRGAGQSPENFRPEEHSREWLLQKLDDSRRNWESLSGQTGPIELCRATRKHFAFGDLKPADWVRLCAMHAAHHLRIVEDIRKTRAAQVDQAANS